MYGLEFTLALMFLAVCFLLAYPFSSSGSKHPPIIKPNMIPNNDPVVVVIGVTSSRGQKVLDMLKTKPVRLIGISRRESRWLRIKHNYPTVSWYYGDLRLTNQMDYLFEQIKRHYGRIDYVINLTYIPGNINSSSAISSIKVKEDLFFKLPQAYDQELLPYDHPGGKMGEESPLFTNIIGFVVLKNLCRKYNVPHAGLILGGDPVVNELINTIVNEGQGVTQFTSIDPKNLTNKINELVVL